MQRLLYSFVLVCSLPVVLGAAPDREGWVNLFDGTTLAGWRTLRGTPIQGWAAEDGVLRFSPSGKKGGNMSLYTEKEYGDFILQLEWKVAPRGNSGIKYRMAWYGKQYLGPEFQLLDDGKRSKENPKGMKGATGSLYDVVPPYPAAWEVKPAGQWNTVKIVARGKHVEHWLNGKKVVEVDLASEAFKKAVGQSKFRSRKGFAQNPKGRIMLQDHGGGVWFRNVRIKELPAKP
jgi:hypothetical protein